LLLDPGEERSLVNQDTATDASNYGIKAI